MFCKLKTSASRRRAGVLFLSETIFEGRRNRAGLKMATARSRIQGTCRNEPVRPLCLPRVFAPSRSRARQTQRPRPEGATIKPSNHSFPTLRDPGSSSRFCFYPVFIFQLSLFCEDLFYCFFRSWLHWFLRILFALGFGFASSFGRHIDIFANIS